MSVKRLQLYFSTYGVVRRGLWGGFSESPIGEKAPNTLRGGLYNVELSQGPGFAIIVRLSYENDSLHCKM